MIDKFLMVFPIFICTCLVVYVIGRYEDHKNKLLVERAGKLGYHLTCHSAHNSYLLGWDSNRGKIVYINETGHESMPVSEIERAELLIDGKLAGMTSLTALGAKVDIFDREAPNRASDIHVEILAKSKKAKDIRVSILSRFDNDDLYVYISEAEDALKVVCRALDQRATPAS